jgi:hypothetical protein
MERTTGNVAGSGGSRKGENTVSRVSGAKSVRRRAEQAAWDVNADLGSNPSANDLVANIRYQADEYHITPELIARALSIDWPTLLADAAQEAK